MVGPHPSGGRRDVASLAQGYTPGVRRLEWASIATYVVLVAWLAIHLAPFVAGSPWLVSSAALLAYLAADLVSGLVHWAADSWGSADLPVIGRALLRPFREHHLDPLAITRHDFVEMNGNNCLISIPTLAIALWVAPRPDGSGSLFASSFLGALVLGVLMTNQFHSWAHLEAPPGWVVTLQRLNLVLPPAHHALHHTRPYNTHYCITVGWMNWPLGWMRFFPALEWCITACTGALPRRDDLGTRAAEAVMAETMPTQVTVARTQH
jgi:plasmanylethanolamine desaturase